MLFTRTDRLIFLINWISYLMLPGLIFSVFLRLQVRPRVSWWWMWFLAAGWCFVMQAGSDANDTFAAIYALAAMDLALRANEKKSVTNLWLSLLAAALLTGAKQNNIPWFLPWLLAAWPGWRLLRTPRPVGTFAVAAVGLFISAVPVTAFNIIHAGNWQGVVQWHSTFLLERRLSSLEIHRQYFFHPNTKSAAAVFSGGGRVGMT